jgi:acyl carrier protein
MPHEIKREIRCFIGENFLFREDVESLSDEASLLDAGVIDSTGVLELIGFLETRFGIEVADEEMLPQNLDCIRAISAYVQRKLAPSAARLAA